MLEREEGANNWSNFVCKSSLKEMIMCLILRMVWKVLTIFQIHAKRNIYMTPVNTAKKITHGMNFNQHIFNLKS